MRMSKELIAEMYRQIPSELNESSQIDQKVMKIVNSAITEIKFELEDLPSGSKPGDKAQEYHRIIAKAKGLFDEGMNKLDRVYK